jgi:hypothetical protein
VLGWSANQWVAVLVCCWAFTLVLGTGWADEARVTAASDADRVVIDASGATVDEILKILAVRFEFSVERNAPPSRTIRFSGPLEGSLEQLLERLLRHEGHMIVRSPGARAGVSRVVLVEAKAAAPVAVVQDRFATLSAGFPERARLQLPELWAGMQ